ncbi:hypothetical protein A3Q56_03571, partial [Intoshia linei]
MKAKVLYNFDAEINSELSCTLGDVVEVMEQDNGNGWFVGRNDNNECGLIPSSYVEIINDNDQPISDFNINQKLDDHFTFDNLNENQNQISDFEDGNEKEDLYIWEESDQSDDQKNTKIRPRQESIINKKNTSNNKIGKKERTELEEYFYVPSDIVKTINVVFEKNCVIWQGSDYKVDVEVSKPQKESKLKGLKTFTTYIIRSNFSHKNKYTVVRRRYKHFEWLRSIMIQTFRCISIPQLPEKNATDEKNCKSTNYTFSEPVHFLNIWSEQASESVHANFKKTWAKYAVTEVNKD